MSYFPVTKPRPGQVYREIHQGRPVSNATYQVCPSCGKLVQTNKLLLGSAHVCS